MGFLALGETEVRPAREAIKTTGHTYFVSTQTAERRPFFRHDRWAALMQGVLEHYRASSYHLHAFVIMPDHLHILLTPRESLERSIQNIKGGFSFRAKRSFDWKHDIWQPGFSDHRIRDVEDLGRHLTYIEHNPAEAGICQHSESYPYLARDLDPFPQRLKPHLEDASGGGAEAPPLQKTSIPRREQNE